MKVDVVLEFEADSAEQVVKTIEEWTLSPHVTLVSIEGMGEGEIEVGDDGHLHLPAPGENLEG